MYLENKTLFFDGNLTRFNVSELLHKIEEFKDKEIKFLDLSKVSNIDSAGVAFLDELMILFREHTPQILNASESVDTTIKMFSSMNITPVVPKEGLNFFTKIGDSLFRWRESIIRGFYLTADIFFWSFVCIFKKKGMRKGSVINQSILIGVDALWIIGLLSFILGLILALQSAAQLRQFGANIFVADLIAISMVREMGPMMTAIIVAGRSGSAIASEIATMKVTEEIDAIRMMALDPIRYIVVPKFLAITICMPLLVTMSTLIGIAGGLIIGITYLDLSAISFINEAINILTFKDVIVGLLKSVFFAWVIVIIGCYYGFSVKGGAEGVGKVTTMSVVASIFWVIVLDAINSIIFYF